MADQPVVLLTTSQFFGLLTVVWALLLAFFAGYKRRLKLQLRSTAMAQPRRPGASWQAGRWDTDDRHAYVANVGDDAAYDVHIIEGERVIATAPIVPAYRADQLSSTSSPPCYVNFCIHADVKHRVAVGANSVTNSVHNASANHGQDRIAVTVTWRAKDGEWSTQRVRAG